MSIAPDANTVDLDPSKLISPVVEQDGKDSIRASAHATWSFASAAWLFILSLPLIAFPRVLSLIFGSLLTQTPEAEGAPEVIRQLNVLERSLAGLAGLACISLASLIVVQTGALPLNSSLSSSASVQHANAAAPFRAPTIVISSLYFAALGWYMYDLGLWLAAGPSGLLAAWGLFNLLFAHEGRVNKVGQPNLDKSGMKKKMEKKDL